jgi:hypothetical protein
MFRHTSGFGKTVLFLSGPKLFIDHAHVAHVFLTILDEWEEYSIRLSHCTAETNIVHKDIRKIRVVSGKHRYYDCTIIILAGIKEVGDSIPVGGIACPYDVPILHGQ